MPPFKDKSTIFISPIKPEHSGIAVVHLSAPFLSLGNCKMWKSPAKQQGAPTLYATSFSLSQDCLLSLLLFGPYYLFLFVFYFFLSIIGTMNFRKQPIKSIFYIIKETKDRIRSLPGALFPKTRLSHNTRIPPALPLSPSSSHSTKGPPQILLTKPSDTLSNMVSCKQMISPFQSCKPFLSSEGYSTPNILTDDLHLH